MARKIRLSPVAEIDLLEIVGHISSKNLAAATNLVTQFDDIFAVLLTQPEMGRKRQELGKSLRSFVFRNYVIFYDPAPNGILIVRILHAARDIDSNMF